ncbi:MAG TPA: helix-turn-helix transcriptional regulator [Dehalococcoidia bacterium]|nr:helix-turn-helix transcriptional regulator [Dehalococcoidia bacterium]
MTRVRRASLIRFGDNVRQVRTERGLSQDELAVRSGSHRNYVGGIERGERNPTFLKVLALAEALEVDVGRLFRGTSGPGKGRRR